MLSNFCICPFKSFSSSFSPHYFTSLLLSVFPTICNMIRCTLLLIYLVWTVPALTCHLPWRWPTERSFRSVGGSGPDTGEQIMLVQAATFRCPSEAVLKDKAFRIKKAAPHCLKFQAVSHNYSGLCQGRWQRKTTHRLVVMATVSCQTDCVEIGQVWTQNQYHPLIPIWHFRPRLCRKMCLWHASWHSWHRCRTTTLNIHDLEQQAIKAICEYDISHLKNAKTLQRQNRRQRCANKLHMAVKSNCISIEQ